MFTIDDSSGINFDLFQMFMFKLIPPTELEINKEELVTKYADRLLKQEKSEKKQLEEPMQSITNCNIEGDTYEALNDTTNHRDLS